MKLKIGDRVRVNPDIQKGEVFHLKGIKWVYTYAHTAYSGREVTISAIDKQGFVKVEQDGFQRFVFHPDMFEEIK